MSGLTTLLDKIQYWAEHETIGDRTALIWFTQDGTEQRMSFRSLYHQIMRASSYLRESGCLKAGDRVMIAADDDVLELTIAIFAVAAAGAAAVPVQTDLSDDPSNRCRAIVQSAGIRTILAGNALPQMQQMFQDRNVISLTAYRQAQPKIPERCDTSTGEFMLLFTSGSTGEPKQVVYTNAMIAYFADLYSRMFHRDLESAAIVTLPLYHAFGNGCTFFPQIWGGGLSILVPPDTFLRDPKRWFRLVTAYHVTHMATLNYTLSFLTQVMEQQPEVVRDADLSSLKALTIGGEYLQEETVSRFCAAARPLGFDERCLSVCYGMTELMILANTPYFAGLKHDVPAEDNGRERSETILCSGEVVGEREVICINEELGILDAGQIGDICITADPVMKEYPGLECINVGDRICYRTGDTGFFLWTEDGRQEIYLCGRSKEILNIKGELYAPFRIEEIAERADERIGKAVAMSVIGGNTEELIVIAECQNGGSQELADRINAQIIRRLPLSAACIAFVPDGSLPRTKMGKLLRKEIRHAYLDGTLKAERFIPSMETAKTADSMNCIRAFLQKYADISDVTEGTPVDTLGLHSLQMQLLAAQLTSQYDAVIRISDIFASKTVGELAALAGRKKETPEHNAGEIYRIPLNRIQRAYIAGRDPEVEWGGVPCQYYTERDLHDLDPERFRIAVHSLMERHPMLRSVVRDNSYLEILEEPCLPVTLHPYSQDTARFAEQTRSRMTSEALPLDGLLFEIVLIEVEPFVWRLHLRIDMICCDAMSMLLFWNDLMQLYEGEPLPPVSCDHLFDPGSESDDCDQCYWEEKVGSFPSVPQLPYRPDCEKSLCGRIRRYQMFLDDEQFNRFESLVTGMGLTVSAAFMALFTELLSAYGAGSEFALNVTVMGRQAGSDEALRMIGEDTRIMLFAAKRRSASLLENALALQKDLREDLAHSGYSGFRFAQKVAAAQDSDVVYPIVFTSLLGLEKLTGSRSIFSMEGFSASSTPQVLLDHQLLPADHGVIVNWDIAEDAFEDGIAQKMFASYQEMIKNAMQPGFWHQELTDIRSEADRKAQDEANRTAEPIPDQLLTEHFAEQAAGCSRTAVIHQGIRYSYAQLLHRSSQFGEMLLASSIHAGDRVMIQSPKSFDLIAAIVGTIRIGAVYVPMPHDQPVSRQYEIYTTCGAGCMVAADDVAVHSGIPCLRMASADAYTGELSDRRPSPDSLAYLIYTSGSTGKPKGVAITHASAMNTILAVNRYLHITENDTFIGLSSVSFDLSVYDIFGVLTAGAALVVPTEAERIDPAAWCSLCNAHNVTIWNSVPALMDMFLEYCAGKNTQVLKLREVVLSGDWIPLNLFGRMKSVLPAARLTSMGGATEASIWSNYYPVTSVEPHWCSIPYGYPLPNQWFHVLDEAGRPLPCGVPGKLYIGGKGLAQGYYNEPELTASAFRLIGGERLYDTGDYGKYDENGCLIFLGRKDAQIKINGYRIELGEIQSALQTLGFAETVIAVHEKNGGSKELLAFVRTDAPFSEAECKRQLTDLLPAYFVPKRVTAVKEFPVTANGKIDRKRLVADLTHGQAQIAIPNGQLSDSDKRLLHVIAEELRLSGLAPDAGLAELGITSLSMIRLANRLEQETGCRIRVNDLLRYQKVSEILAFYAERQPDELTQGEQIISDDPDHSHPVMDILREELEMPSLCPDDPLRESGLSSIAVIRTANRLEMLYGTRPTVQELSAFDTARELIGYYAGREPVEMRPAEEHSAVRQLVERCRTMEISLWAEDGKLRFKAPKGAVTPELKNTLSEYKQELITYLSEHDGIVVPELTALQTAYVVGRQNQYALGDITANYYVEYLAEHLNVQKLEKALDQVIAQNEILRTVIYPNGTAKALNEVPHYTIELLAPDDPRDLREEMVTHSFPLGTWPMLDIRVKQKNEQSAVVHINIDCLILDGWSIRSFLTQLLSAYQGKPADTTDYTFREYLADEQERIRSRMYDRAAKQYWETQIEQLPPAPHLPMKTPIDQIQRPEFRRMSFTLPEEATAKFWEKLKRYRLTPSLALCTAYMMSLSKWSKNQDVTLNLTMFNRQPVHPDVQKVLGDFTNIALIGYRHSEGTFLEQTAQTGQQLWNAIEYRSCNVINLLGRLAERHGDVIAAPYVFTSLIDVDNDMGHEMLAEAGFTEIFAQTRTPQVLLDHQVYYSGGRLILGIDYVEQAFDTDMLSAMFRDYTDRVMHLAEMEDWEK